MRYAEIGEKILQAVFQNKWLSVEYKNKKNEISRYWLGIQDIDQEKELLSGEGFHLMLHSITAMAGLNLRSIISAKPIDESWYNVPENLKEKIRRYPNRFQSLFGYFPDLNILDYLFECAKLNTTPYRSDYSLLENFDGDLLKDGEYKLKPEQFRRLISGFQANAKNNSVWNITKYLCMNILSIYTKKGLYVLAYKALRLDVKRQILIPEGKITVCRQFKIGKKEEENIRFFLDNDEQEWLDDFEQNQEKIKNAITKKLNFPAGKIDDLPYIIPLSRDISLNLEREYDFIKTQIKNGIASDPLRAFFGALTKPPVRRKNYPLALLSGKVNLDQLLAIYHAIKYPLCYIQGPPGTGKTTTILNTIFSAFFNDKTLLLSSFNNHPIDSICGTLHKIQYRGKYIPFPVFRIGRKEVILNSLNFWRERFYEFQNTPVYSDTLERNKEKEKAKSEKLTELLKLYEEKIDLEERENTIERILPISNNMTYQFHLEAGQLQNVKRRIQEIGEIQNEDVLNLVYSDQNELLKYMYYSSIKFIRQIGSKENADFLEILQTENEEEKLKLFNAFLKDKENIRRFLKIFPVIAGTCISCGKIGDPDVYFDMTVMDEAGQCDTAYSLVPILRGKQLMLVGDPQQLAPVIVLDSQVNEALKKIYRLPEEYDYIKNSVYKVFLAADSVSREILLRYHYRCAPEIISFNNEKYYNNLLKVERKSSGKFPLVFCNIQEEQALEKNLAPEEAREAVRYAKEHPEKTIGIITPFVKQKELIRQQIEEENLKNVSCGTVHAFQGDEKDVVLLSLAISGKTPVQTYEWLKNNRELVNVATSRAKNQLIVFGCEREIQRLHEIGVQEEHSEENTKCLNPGKIDDIYDLVNYIKTKGSYKITPYKASSRALGLKPFSTETEEEFLTTLGHALDNVINRPGKCSVKKEVPISAVFEADPVEPDLFYKGRFDFVLFERGIDKKERAVLAIELDGKEHAEKQAVIRRDRKKNEICARHRLQLIRVDNTYARRYYYIKNILAKFFAEK